MKKQENGKTIIFVLETIGPVHTYSDIQFEKGDFFLRVSLPSTCKRRFLGTKNVGFRKPFRSGDFLKRRLLSFHAKKVFEYFDVIHHMLLVLRMLGRGIYYNSKTFKVLAFLSRRAN